ncbi:cyclic nucleotide-binding domain-containing protein [Sulfurimonas sp. MAG313]|nr:cyclic nucleotide-binding domain-containing protein [Sulfurimonas sp. MAG313]MDF1881065.1 cyclic nucleotide-binding domain-containing protein [Sulfurimonas sp. MAG313]
MSLPINSDEILLPEQFINQAEEYIQKIIDYKMDKIVLLQDNVIPSVVVIKYDKLTKMLTPGANLDPINREKISREMSMLLAVRKRIHFFDNLSDEEIVGLTEKSDFMRPTKGNHVFEQGDFGKEIFYIVNGKIDIYGYNEQVTGDDPFSHLTTLEEGMVFGEIGAITGEARTARATVASDDAFILSITLQSSITCSNSLSYVKVYKNIIESLSSKLISTNNQLYPFIKK